MKQTIFTTDAPKAIGTYSQAVRVGNLVFLSGQIPLDPVNMQIIDEDFAKQAVQVFNNIKAVVTAAGGNLAQIVKLTIYLTDLSQFPLVNQIMGDYFEQPYPARATIEVSALPKEAKIEIDAILVLE